MSPAAPARDGHSFTHELSEALRAEVLAGKYRLLAGIGRGGMADVFLGSASGPAGVNKLVVIKRLRDGHGDNPTFVSMFLDEARLAARLNHPNIVHTYEVHEVGNEYIIVMEYLEGQPLRRFIKAFAAREECCPPALAAHLMVEILNGLHYVHEMADYDGTPLRIVHRDVSPQNLFITYDGQVKVLDFGIAKGTLNATETQSGVLKGKFAYMAPEQASAEAVDRRADLFATGVVMWELLTRRRLFRGDTANTLLQLVSAPIPAPSSVSPGVPPELDQIVLKALARSPDARFSTALEMSSALSDFIERSRQVVRHQDVARTMLQLFGDERDDMTRRVQSYMSSRVPMLSMPMVEREATASTALLQSTSTVLPPATPQIARQRLWPFFATAAVALTSVVGAFWARAHPKPLPTSHPALIGRANKEWSESFHLTLSSQPIEAQVEWGGKIVGQTPLLIDLLPGPQTFVLSHNGHYNATVLVNVSPGMAGREESRTVVMVAREQPEPSKAAAASPPHLVERGGSKSPSLPSEPADVDVVDAATEALPPAPVPELEAEPELAGLRPQPVAPAPATSAGPVVAARSAPTVLPFGPDMTRPVLLSGADLVVPREARVARISGTMIARCTITSDGALRDCRIIKGLPFLDQPMLASLATRRYRPVFADGKAVSVQYIFNLKIDSLS